MKCCGVRGGPNLIKVAAGSAQGKRQCSVKFDTLQQFHHQGGIWILKKTRFAEVQLLLNIMPKWSSLSMVLNLYQIANHIIKNILRIALENQTR
jgi:hypothetical protein